MILFEEAFLSGMSFRSLLHLSLMSDRFRITIVILRIPLIDILPKQITSVDMTPPSLFSGMNINYVTDKEYFRTFSVYTHKLRQWRQAFEQANIRVVVSD
jgi:hypothetical protein